MAARLLITGAGGQVGRFLAGEAVRLGQQVRAVGHRELDITDPAAVAAHIGGGDVVVNCAALTNVDHCETDPQSAFAVNATGPGNLARRCAEVGARLVHISTDYVFGEHVFGEAENRRPYEISDPTGPVNTYGASKLAGERAVLDALPGAHIVRTSWVYTGGDGTDFVAAMRRLAATDGDIEVVDDQIGSPTYVKDLVTALLDIVAGDVRGPILHVANAGEASRFEQAQAVFAELGADPRRVRPVSTAQAPRPARRPVYSALSMAASVRAGLRAPRPWREALAAALGSPPDDGRITSTA